MKSTNSKVFEFKVESNYLYGTSGPRRVGATGYQGFPVRLCMPASAGAFAPDEPLELRDAKGKVVPSTIRPLIRWADGTVRVWDVCFPASLKRGETLPYEIHCASKTAVAKVARRFLASPSVFTVCATLDDGSVLRREVRFAAPAMSKNAFAHCEQEEAFELVKVGAFTAFKGALVRKTWSGYPGMELSIRLINWAPGEAMAVKGVRIEYDLPGQGACRYAINQSAVTATTPKLIEGGTHYAVRADAGGVHVSDLAQLGQMETDHPSYERGDYLASVDSWVGMADDHAGWVLAVPDAHERMPKGWIVNGRHVTIEVHPEWAAPLQWRRGMAVFQRVYLACISKDATAADFENEGWRWLRQPLVQIGADNYCAAGWRIPFQYRPKRFPRTEYTIRETWAFSWPHNTFDWGDQSFGAKKRNHEYDFIACAAKEFARTGRTEVFKLCRAAAEHMMYTDFVAVSEDPWKEGGVPAHCNNHTDGAAYPSHMWTEGLVLYYLMTGDRYALQVAMRVGDFFVKYVNERFQVIEATGREMGWTLVAMAALYDVTREERYLGVIRKIVDFYLAAGVEDFFPTDATFAVGVALIGLDRIRPYHRGEEVKAFILGVLDWLIANRCDEVGIFDYWYDAERKAFSYIQAHLPEAFHIGYRLSGDVRYLKVAWRLYQIHLGGAVLTVQDRFMPAECGYAAGYHIAWVMGCLAAFAERGWLDRLQYAEPE